MKQTPNLLLKLPEPTDYVQVEDLNENFTKIDTEIAKITDEEKGVEAKLTKHLDDINPHGIKFYTEKFDTPGTFVWTVPEGVYQVIVSGCGGGGGGCGGTTSTNVVNGTAGGVTSFGSYISASGGSGAAPGSGGSAGGFGGGRTGRPTSDVPFSGGDTLFSTSDPSSVKTYSGYGYGGNGGQYSSGTHLYGGGGGGCILEHLVPVSPLEEITIRVGAGGIGGIPSGSTTTHQGKDGGKGVLFIKYVKAGGAI